MANVQFSACDFASGGATGALFYDDQTLLIVLAEYTNVTDKPMAAQVTNPQGAVTRFVWPAFGTASNRGNGSSSSDLSPFGLHMVRTQVTTRHGTGFVVNLPAGWSIGYSYG